MKIIFLFILLQTIVYSQQKTALKTPTALSSLLRSKRHIQSNCCSSSSCSNCSSQKCCSTPCTSSSTKCASSNCCQSSQNCCSSSQCSQQQNCCVNQCSICQTPVCRVNTQCNQCCQQHCERNNVVERERSSSSDQLSSSMSNTASRQDSVDSEVQTRVNFTNVVMNRNEINVPITINNRNELFSSHNSSASTSRRDSVSEKEVSRTKYVRVPVPQPIPYPVHQPVPVPVHIPIPVTRHVPIPFPVNRPVPVPVPIPIPIQTHPCYGIACEVTRPYFHRNVCNAPHDCQTFQQDCSGCHSDFYMNHNEYESCYGCFL